MVGFCFRLLVVYLNFRIGILIGMLFAGNCDNCVSSKKERDMSRESFLLMACIRSSGGRWGLNMPVDILRGSRVSFRLLFTVIFFCLKQRLVHHTKSILEAVNWRLQDLTIPYFQQ